MKFIIDVKVLQESYRRDMIEVSYFTAGWQFAEPKWKFRRAIQPPKLSKDIQSLTHRDFMKNDKSKTSWDIS